MEETQTPATAARPTRILFHLLAISGAITKKQRPEDCEYLQRWFPHHRQALRARAWRRTRRRARTRSSWACGARRGSYTARRRRRRLGDKSLRKARRTVNTLAVAFVETSRRGSVGAGAGSADRFDAAGEKVQDVVGGAQAGAVVGDVVAA